MERRQNNCFSTKNNEINCIKRNLLEYNLNSANDVYTVRLSNYQLRNKAQKCKPNNEQDLLN